MKKAYEFLKENQYFIFFMQIVRLALGYMFIIASIGKILDPGTFMSKMYEYAILPGYIVPLFSAIMPWIEFSVGVLLLFDMYVRAAAILASFSLFAFIAAIFIQISKGVSMDCGCFDFLIPDETVGYMTIIRDFVMVGFSLLVVVFANNKLSLFGLYDSYIRRVQDK